MFPAAADADFLEVLPDEIYYNAPTPVSRERVAEVPDFPMLGPTNSVTRRIPAPHLSRMAYVYFEELVHDAWTAVELKIPVALAK